MNHSNTSNLKDTITATLQEILTEEPNFFFTNRLSILSWKSKKIEGALITKVGNIRYLGLLRKDQKGQEYWKYKPLTSNSETSEKEGNAEHSPREVRSDISQKESPTIQPNNSPNQLENKVSLTEETAKFQQRQAKTQALNKDN